MAAGGQVKVIAALQTVNFTPITDLSFDAGDLFFAVYAGPPEFHRMTQALR